MIRAHKLHKNPNLNQFNQKYKLQYKYFQTRTYKKLSQGNYE